MEVGQERTLAVLLHLVEGDGVDYRLDQAAVVGRHQDVAGTHPERDVLLSPDVLCGTGVDRCKTLVIPKLTRSKGFNGRYDVHTSKERYIISVQLVTAFVL